MLHASPTDPAGQEVQAAEVLQLTRRGGLDLDAYDAPVSGFEDYVHLAAAMIADVVPCRTDSAPGPLPRRLPGTRRDRVYACERSVLVDAKCLTQDAPVPILDSAHAMGGAIFVARRIRRRPSPVALATSKPPPCA